MKPKYNRIMLKLSGEGLSGADGFGIDFAKLNTLAGEIAEIQKAGIQVCLVIGGGNFFRGAKNADKLMDRSVADQIGMMATVMNALSMKAALESVNCPCTVFSGLQMPQVCENYNFTKALSAVESGKVVIFAGGTGSPYFTTDSGAVLRAVEMHCEVVMKATQVDGVYSGDPKTDKHAVRYDEISYDEVLAKHLRVMDITAITLAQDYDVQIMVFAQNNKGAIIDALCGCGKSTIIK